MDEPEEFDLVMPFVTVQSVGGPHDDNSYVAGYEMGSLDKVLTQRALQGAMTPFRSVLRADNRAQADLIAMQHGYAMSVNATEDEHWIGVEFTRT